MIPLKAIIIILIIHTVFDFLLQTRKMAENKSKFGNTKDGDKALFSHVGVYFCGLILMVLSLDVKLFGMFVVFNTVLHFVTDLITSKVSAHFYQANQLNYFWNTIGVDQAIHFITLFSLYVACN